MAKIRIRDTGKLDDSDTSATYTAINSGSWIELLGFSLRGEFTVTGTTNVATLTDSNDSALLTYKSNDVAALQAPRLTLRGVVLASDDTLIQNIVKIGRSKSVKHLSGGAGMISALPEKSTDTYDYIPVIVKNITFTEEVRNGTDYIGFTIQLEQH